MSGTHARLSPSGAAGWMNCAQWASDSAGSKYARYGTACHDLAARVLRGGTHAGDHLGETIEADGEAFTVDQDMVDLVSTYTDQVRSFGATHDTYVEVAVPIGHLTGEDGARGTADVVLLCDTTGEMLVMDLKTGRGHEVDPVRNPQLMLYALGAVREFSGFCPTTITLGIAQPSLREELALWSTTPQELEAFAKRVTAAAQVHGRAAPTPGQAQCQWCAKKATCSALADRVQAELGAAFEDLTTESKAEQDAIVQQLLTHADVARALGAVDLIEDWCKALRTEAERRLHNGQAVPGWKLVAGKRGARQWRDSKAAEELLRKRFRLKVEQAFELKLISPTTAEKLLKGQPKRWAQALEHVTQGEGRATVARLSDKRPALEVKPVAELFDDQTGADLA